MPDGVGRRPSYVWLSHTTMRRILIGGLASLLVAGCSQETVYRPHFQSPSAPATKAPVPSPPTASPPSDAPPEKAQIVEKLGDIDVAGYGIPIYPGATIKQDSSFAYQAGSKGDKQTMVTMESFADVPTITRWYRQQIKNSKAYALGELGTLDGVTVTNHPIKISIAKVESKSVIDITVAENPKK